MTTDDICFKMNRSFAQMQFSLFRFFNFSVANKKEIAELSFLQTRKKKREKTVDN